MSQLKCWTNGTDTYIAESVEQVKEMYVLQNGYVSVEELDSYEEFDAGDWWEYEDDSYIIIADDEWRCRLISDDRYMEIPENCMIQCRANASEWVKTAHGKPMFLCSTEW